VLSDKASRLLTAKQWAITKLVADGLKNKEIARKLGTTENMVKNYLRAIFDKTGMWSRLELALWFVKQTHSSTASGGKA
jgi:DNA-binding NarL/FixJ family response regulator